MPRSRPASKLISYHKHTKQYYVTRGGRRIYTNVEEYINDTDPTEFIDYRKPEDNVHSLRRGNTVRSQVGK